MQVERRKKHRPYHLMLFIYFIFAVFAFAIDTPTEILSGLIQIVKSRSTLISDYMAIGGIGATLINASIVGAFSVLMQMAVGTRPNGSTLMAMFLSTGFAMQGKNILNMLPITFGVWLYARYKKEPLMNYTLAALLSATLSPAVSSFCFHPDLPPQVSFPLGIFMGVFIGFIFPPVSQATVRVHSGYSLYNMGFAGGLISTFIVSGFEAIGLRTENTVEWSTGNNLVLAILLYVISAFLMLYGLFASGELKLPPYRDMMEHSGRVLTDMLVLHGNSAYFNMGLLGAFSTTAMLLLGADLNGPTICGILTIMGFGAFGKHLRNVTPIMIGAIAATYVNKWDPRYPSNILAILFSTGLAPIAGEFGWVWGIVTGFLHVNLMLHIGFLNSGLNLYNNGYASGFVVMFILPVILALHRQAPYDKSRQKREEK